MKSLVTALLLLISTATSLLANSIPPIETRIYDTKRINGRAPTIDGRLNDLIWNTVEWSGEFIQRNPTDGDPPTEQTKFKVLYDDEALYFAFFCHDDPELVTSMLARRDWFPGDWIEVNIDSYFDRRTAFSFTLSLSGTRGDEFVSNDGNNWDSNWDPVWQGATRINDGGWTAEMKIPLSQLRFSSEEEQTWGLQVQRRIFREEERSTWQRIPKDAAGWVSKFGHLRGILSIRPSRHIELLPYGVAKAENFEKIPGNPFLDGSASQFTGGLDGKIGVTSNLILDFTINPDFGQVEADPSEVNLSAFETFFQEKRPFFIEGNNILELPLAPAITGGSFTQDKLFYSRRIGRRPTYWPDLAVDESLDQPDYTSILGAFKLTGKTPGGLSIGFMESITAKEKAEIDNNGRRRQETVEPLTNYFVGRVQQDFRKGDTHLGAMATAVNRDIDDPHLDFMRRQAYASGLDFSHYFKKRDYRIEANILASHLRGSEEAIYDAQVSSARYFQRPDNDYVSLDPNRTALSGYSGSVRFTRTSNSKFVFETGVALRSPGFEINDLGYMRNADQINQFTWAGYYFRNPFSIFNNVGINTNQWLYWDFGGNLLLRAANANAHANFRNNYHVCGGVTRSWESTSNTALRGGPSSKWPGTWEFNFHVATDHRKKINFGFGGYTQQGDEDSEDYREGWMELIVRPTNAMRLYFNPSISRNRPEMQYVSTESFGSEDRYLFGRLDQKTTAMTFRLDYCITPNLTVQYYGAPFVSAGRYSGFKRITNSRADKYQDRFNVFDEGQIAYDSIDNVYYIDEDENATNDYAIDNPDFNFRDFNSNLVIRWEYMPGSLLYLVWSQARSEYQSFGEFDFDRDMRGLFDVHPHDIFLIKFIKWFSL
ncbi:MAG: hypothetical protein GTO29_13485 [Candidatus Latescibacteria bacterium]|nr:hypothetical protein [Candidatus Latescibacterota bacterium]NIO57264.1 hypothetical protein [Candidatus Latescibacterota bacterium]